jgi:hypothetical protein
VQIPAPPPAVASPTIATPPSPVLPSAPAPAIPTATAPVETTARSAPVAPVAPPIEPIRTPAPVPSPVATPSPVRSGPPVAPPVAPPAVEEQVIANSKWVAPKAVAAADPDAGRTAVPELPQAPPAAVAPPPPKKTLPPLQYVNQPEFTLEYELSRVGPSGIGTVELWLTRDDGQTWRLYARPEDEPNTIKSGRHQGRVRLLDGDGVYGFTLVVKSKAGLGRTPPRSGDVPEIRVELDTSLPIAKLFQPGPDPHKQGHLLLKWEATDPNLAEASICLEWAEQRDGPWQPIGLDLRNDGRFSWKLPERMPVNVYLRLRAKDKAGNESIAVTPQPQLVDLSEPEGRLVNVSVPPRR